MGSRGDTGCDCYSRDRPGSPERDVDLASMDDILPPYLWDVTSHLGHVGRSHHSIAPVSG
jgi:hypothetical protein